MNPNTQSRVFAPPTQAPAPVNVNPPANPIASILQVLRQGERFLVCSHARPDGDAVGSMLAMGMLLEQMGKRADLVTADRIPNIYRRVARSRRHPLRDARSWPL